MRYHLMVVILALALALMGFSMLSAVAILERDWLKGAMVVAGVLTLVAFIYKVTRGR